MSNDTPGRHAKDRQLDRVALRERRRLERAARQARPVDDFGRIAMAGAVAARALALHEWNKRVRTESADD